MRCDRGIEFVLSQAAAKIPIAEDLWQIPWPFGEFGPYPYGKGSGEAQTTGMSLRSLLGVATGIQDLEVAAIKQRPAIPHLHDVVEIRWGSGSPT